jgi:hypothetical protein
VAGIVPKVAGLALGGGPPSGRVWVLDWNSRVRAADGYSRCAPDQNFGVSRIMCLQRDGANTIEDERPPGELREQLALVRHHATRA